MFTNRIKHTTQIDQSWTIELKRGDGGSSRWRQAEYESEVIVPGKMFFPAVLARMKQRRECSSDGIWYSSACGLMLVAAVTTEGQLISRCRPTETAWYDVIHLKASAEYRA
jgi:hypothetical protein